MTFLTKVTWTTASGVCGSGKVISVCPIFEGDASKGEPRIPHVLVAVDAPQGEEHRVIYCAETWLTAVS